MSKMMFSALVREAAAFAVNEFLNDGIQVSPLPLQLKVGDADIDIRAWKMPVAPEYVRTVKIRWERGYSATIIVAKFAGTHNHYEVLECTLKDEQSKRTVFMVSDMSDHDSTQWVKMEPFPNFFEGLDDGMFGFMDKT